MQVPNFGLAFIVVIVILLPSIAIWAFTDAKKRGKNTNEAMLWSIGAFFLPMFVLPAWYWARPNFEKVNEYLCPECKEVYKGKKIVCPYCGYMLPGEEIVDLSGSDTLDSDEPPLPPTQNNNSKHKPS